jgi:hypothetical protein
VGQEQGSVVHVALRARLVPRPVCLATFPPAFLTTRVPARVETPRSLLDAAFAIFLRQEGVRD